MTTCSSCRPSRTTISSCRSRTPRRRGRPCTPRFPRRRRRPVNDEPEVLQGGVGNAGAVVRVGPHVLRPTNPHSPTIHALLRHIHAVGFDAAPEVVAIEADGRERLVFIVGDVPVPPFPAWSQTDAVLASTASLLRRFHDATVGFAAPPGATWSDEMRDPNPVGDVVICHNDVCPENVVYRDGVAVALVGLRVRRARPSRLRRRVPRAMCVPIEADEDAARTGRGGLDPYTRLAWWPTRTGSWGRIGRHCSTCSPNRSTREVPSCGAGSRPARRRSSRCGSPWAARNASIGAAAGSRPSDRASRTC